ncbi:hypothetical protein MILUP08_42194 [Micromonospora lupini str. Lupac 08]|uniref:Uncharacterized protein n=1 Tax=Micromonospora lupini str. Lupac 08 TaxID=1150864 RepID=I0L0C7_9ACTN|nr:hypothetical protein MILUP08_42194 [Micromonospora lupini str. Lupac 08]
MREQCPPIEPVARFSLPVTGLT